eukprot:9312474-Alexandrium_andersonii.AAC.1
MATAPATAADHGVPVDLPPPLRGLGGERPGPGVVLLCDDCGRRIPELDSHGVPQCRLCGSAARLAQVIRGHATALTPRECAAMEAAIWGLIGGVMELASLDAETAAEQFGAGRGPPVDRRPPLAADDDA